MDKEIKLKKDLPSCPKGRVLKLDIAGGYFVSVKDYEIIDRSIIPYKYSFEDVLRNPDWFDFSSKSDLGKYANDNFDKNSVSDNELKNSLPEELLGAHIIYTNENRSRETVHYRLKIFQFDDFNVVGYFSNSGVLGDYYNDHWCEFRHESLRKCLLYVHNWIKDKDNKVFFEEELDKKDFYIKD